MKTINRIEFVNTLRSIFFLSAFILTVNIASAAPSCQLLLAPTQKEFSKYLKKFLIEYQSKVEFLDHTSLEKEVSVVIATSPLEFLFQFHHEYFGSNKPSPQPSVLNDEIRLNFFSLRPVFAKSIYLHRANRDERASLIQWIIESYHFDFPFMDFMDSLIGLDTRKLEKEEARQLSNKDHWHEKGISTNSKDGIGLGQRHDFWFSAHSYLIRELKLAHDLNVKTIVDLGTGTGRLGLLAGFLYPEMKFIGLDLFGPRIKAGQAAAKRFGFSDRIQLKIQDLLDESKPLPVADYYYIYGPTNSDVINNQVVNRLRPIFAERLTFISSLHHVTTSILDGKPWLVTLAPNRAMPGTVFVSK